MKKAVESCPEMCMTGWRSPWGLHALRKEFFSADYQSLDAPEHIPAGSSFFGKFSKHVLSTTTRRENGFLNSC